MMVRSLERLESSMARLSFIEPDENAVAFRQRAEIDLAVVIDVARDDGNDAVVKREDLRGAVREPDDDVRVRRTREHNAIDEAITIEVGLHRRISR